jgi:hypothetical protein
LTPTRPTPNINPLAIRARKPPASRRA